MNNRKKNFVSVPEFDIIIIEDFDKRMKQRNAAKTLRRDYTLYHIGIYDKICMTYRNTRSGESGIFHVFGVKI